MIPKGFSGGAELLPYNSLDRLYTFKFRDCVRFGRKLLPSRLRRAISLGEGGFRIDEGFLLFCDSMQLSGGRRKRSVV